MLVSVESKILKSPLNYIGGKYKLLPQILPLFPKNINTFIDLFAGGCNVGINVQANKIIFNDNLIFLVDMYNSILNESLDITLNHIEERINYFKLDLTNNEGYIDLRNEYNKNKIPLDLFVLIAYSFNHQIRFNSKHEYNNPFGKNRSSFNENMKSNLIKFILKLKDSNCEFTKFNFNEIDIVSLKADDFVYCDPPYLITTGSYNDGKRGFKGWGVKEEMELLFLLDSLNSKGIKFALSNVLYHKGKSNDLLLDWINNNNRLNVHYLNFSYSNSNYQTLVRDKDSSVEVLITNYGE